LHKREVELFPLTKMEQQMAERAYFANRIELLIRLKRWRTKRAKVVQAAVEQLLCFPRSDDEDTQNGSSGKRIGQRQGET
jgi:hypothetical protein